MPADSFAGHVRDFFFTSESNGTACHDYSLCVSRLCPLLGTTVPITWHDHAYYLARPFLITWHNDCSYRRRRGIYTSKVRKVYETLLLPLPVYPVKAILLHPSR